LRPFTDTIFIGKALHHLQRVDSTNDYLRHLLRSPERPPAEGMVVVADEQFAGRGQGGSIWQSEGYMNLTCSILLYPKFLVPQHIFYLNKAIALAARDCAAILSEGSEVDITIKWPNDIYAADRKLGGILVENSFNSTSVQNSIIGIGINVNQQDFDHLLPNPVSLRQITGRQHNIEDVLKVLCAQIEKQYLQMRSGYLEKINAAYHTHLFGRQKPMRFKMGVEIFEGTIRQVNDNGQLVIETPHGLKEFNTREIAFLF